MAQSEMVVFDNFRNIIFKFNSVGETFTNSYYSGIRDAFRIQSNIYGGAFCENS